MPTPTLPPRLRLARLPTPLQRLDRLSAAWGGPTVWVKRDDLTGYGLSGNKIRKLEYHLAAAKDAGADTVVTCGAGQSNHCRTTALACAAVGLRVVLVLWTPDGAPPETLTGNHLLDRLAGAEIRFVTRSRYADRTTLLEETAAEIAGAGGRPWVIPEGGSDALGMWGFVTAMGELDQQIAAVGRPAAIWHPASSGGTTAGLGWAADRLGNEMPLLACSVGEPESELRARIDGIWSEAMERNGGRRPAPPLELIDDHVGGGYGVTADEELRTQAEFTALTGLILDPTYTGKAVHGLRREIVDGRFGSDDDVVLWHTGGGFGVFAHDLGPVLASPPPG